MYSRRKFLSMVGAGAGALAAPGIAGLVARRGGVERNEFRKESLWTSETAGMGPMPLLEGDREFDLAIVGGGYTGLSCAYYAKRQRPEWSVAVLEAYRMGSGASSRNSGAVYASYRGLDDSGMPHRGFERFSGFIEEEEIECDFRHASVLHVCATKREAEKARSAIAPGTKWIGPGELRESINTSYYEGAVEHSGYYSIHPAKLVWGLVKAAQRQGAELFEHSPVLRVKAATPAELITPKGTVRAKRVFLATNAHTPRLGFLKYVMMPVHQFTLATRKLSEEETRELGLDRWSLRFEHYLLPVTTDITPSGHFFIRIVLGYASFNSCVWRDIEGARELAAKMFKQRYPWVGELRLERGWHGVTGHTLKAREIASPIESDNIHASVAYNGLGVMPGHNNGYLSACRITGHEESDIRYLAGPSGHIPIPGEYYRSAILKPFMKLATPV